jgi:hypothetical protein
VTYQSDVVPEHHDAAKSLAAVIYMRKDQSRVEELQQRVCSGYDGIAIIHLLDKEIAMGDKHKGTCFCGAVEVEVTGEPLGMGYCHCSSCRSWSAGPINAFTLWKPENVNVTRGADKLREFHKSSNSHRKWCDACGGHVMTEHPQWGLVDVYAATIPTLSFKPGVHVNYAETVLAMKDGLPKLRDFPKELGGTGEALTE